MDNEFLNRGYGYSQLDDEQKNQDVPTLVRQACQDGNLDAFNLLVLKYEKNVFNLALTYFQGDIYTADDITQETFIRAYNLRHTYKKDDNFVGWLLKIASSRCANEYRARVRKPAILLDDERHGAGHTESNDSRFEIRSRRTALFDCLSNISYERGVVVRLHWISGYKYQEISELLEVKLNTVRTRIHRGMATMQQCLCSGYQDLFSGNCS